MAILRTKQLQAWLKLNATADAHPAMVKPRPRHLCSEPGAPDLIS